MEAGSCIYKKDARPAYRTDTLHQFMQYRCDVRKELVVCTSVEQREDLLDQLRKLRGSGTAQVELVLSLGETHYTQTIGTQEAQI
eukprot:2547378-Amphidinium_carterae.1